MDARDRTISGQHIILIVLPQAHAPRRRLFLNPRPIPGDEVVVRDTWAMSGVQCCTFRRAILGDDMTLKIGRLIRQMDNSFPFFLRI